MAFTSGERITDGVASWDADDAEVEVAAVSAVAAAEDGVRYAPLRTLRLLTTRWMKRMTMPSPVKPVFSDITMDRKKKSYIDYFYRNLVLLLRKDIKSMTIQKSFKKSLI